MKVESSSNPRTSTNQKTNRLLLGALVCSTLTLSACGGRDASDDLSSNFSGNVPTYQGKPADTIATETLQRNASVAASDSMATALNSVVAAMNGSSALGQAFSVPGADSRVAANPDGVFNDASDSGPLINAEFDTRVRNETSGTFSASLGLAGQPSTTRNGNKITIDPDEGVICAEQGYASQSAQCEQLLADLVVEIDAASDKSGTINYLFRSNTVASVSYSPVYASYELKLKGLHDLLVSAQQLGLEVDSPADSMSGSIRIEARVLNATPGAESGSMIISIPEAVSIANASEGADMNIAPSTLMQMSASAATGDLAMEVNIGAVALASRNADIVGSPIQKLVMSGMTAKASITSNGNLLTVSNVGLGSGPLTMSVDSLEAVRASLDNFGFVVDQKTNKIVLNGDLNFAMTANNILGVLDEYESHDSAAEISVQASSGTTFTELLSGVMRLDQGGPLVVGYDVSDGVTSAAGTVNVGMGQCFGDSYSSDAPIGIVGCN